MIIVFAYLVTMIMPVLRLMSRQQVSEDALRGENSPARFGWRG